MPISTGVVSLPLKATLRAVFQVTAQAGGAASDEIVDETLLKGRYRMRLRIAWSKTAQDVGDFQVGVGFN
jgi:hypothetical protein